MEAGKVVKLLMAIMLIALVIPGFAGAEEIQVAVAIPPLETFVEEVGGEEVKSVVMIPPGRSPANYAPSPRELAAFSDSVIYFSLGLPAEEAGILSEAREINPDLKIVRLDEKVAEVYEPLYPGDEELQEGESRSEEQQQENDESSGTGGHRHSDGEDPHIWLSPRRAELMVEIIAAELGSINESKKEQYLQRAEEYIDKIRATDMEIRGMLEEFQGRRFMIFHPSFGYFADEYGLEMVALEAEGKEASARRLQEITELAAEEGIETVFYQQEIDSRQTEVLAEEIGAETERLFPLASNYCDNLLQTARLLRESIGVDDDGSS